MKKKFLVLTLIIIFLLSFILFGFFLLNSDTNDNFAKKIKDNTPSLIKDILKKTIFYIPIQNRELIKSKKTIDTLNLENNNLRLQNLKLNNLINQGRLDNEIDLNKGSEHKYYSFVLPFFDENDLAANKLSGYLEILDDYVFVIFTSGKSILIDKKKLLDKKFEYQELKNNLNEKKIFNQKIKWTGIKDVKIIDEDIYVSITKEIKKNCYNTSLFQAKINFSNLNFIELLDLDECFSLTKKIEAFKYFNGYQTGGRITRDNNNELIYLTIGDYNNWEGPQDLNSYGGKVISINKKDKSIKIVSKGHRNPQGMYIISKFNKAISTEHGPKGGDEINIIDLKKDKINNYGWPISSYGDHYDVVPINKFTKKIAPLYKSHSLYGFIEPIKYFAKSIGISEIIENFQKENNYYVTSLKDKAIYEIELKADNNDLKFNKFIKKINIKERIRDIIYDFDTECYFIYGEITPKLILKCNKK